MTHFTEAILAASKARAAPLCWYNKLVLVQQAVRNAAGGQKRPALRVGRIGAPGALRRLPDARTAPTRATRSAPMK
jgi:hypothetical protein